MVLAFQLFPSCNCAMLGACSVHPFFCHGVKYDVGINLHKLMFSLKISLLEHIQACPVNA